MSLGFDKMAAASDQFRVLVVGGGNCGLAVATGLKKAGIPCTVFERDNENDFTHNIRDWGMLLHWATDYFEKLLPEHLQIRIKESRVDPNLEMDAPVPYLNAETGEIMKNIETPTISRVSRKKMRRFLTEGENLDIQFDKKLRSISVQGANVVAEFEDGTIEIGSTIVGCDGSHSVVRNFLVGENAAQLEDTGVTMVNCAAEGYTPDQARLLRSYHPILKFALNHSKLPGGALLAALDIPDPNDTTDWKFQIYTSWYGLPYADNLHDPVVRMEFVRERMAQFCEPFRTAFLAVAEDKVLPVFPGRQWAPRMKWDNYGGRVTLAGDAAHAMLPHRGQGLNNAIKDASDIVDAIKAANAGTQSLEHGITAYEDEMRVRGTREVELSFQQMQMTAKKDIVNSPMFKIGLRRHDATPAANGVQTEAETER